MQVAVHGLSTILRCLDEVACGWRSASRGASAIAWKDKCERLAAVQTFSLCHTHGLSLSQSARSKKKRNGTIIPLEEISPDRTMGPGVCDAPDFLISTKAPNTIVNPVYCDSLSRLPGEMCTKRLADSAYFERLTSSKIC
jgi:hypothetical protein